jgi:FixJ family two-component response regulator
MPEMNGRKLSERLRVERANIKTVFMSGYTDNAIVHQGMLDPGVFFLEKPTPPQALLQMIRTVLTSEG